MILWYAADVIVKAGLIIITFIIAALIFGTVLNIILSNLVEEDLHDSDQSKTTRLLRRVPRRKGKTRFPDCTETNFKASVDEKGEI